MITLHSIIIKVLTFLTKSKESQLSCGSPASDLKGIGVWDPNTVAGCSLHGGPMQHRRLLASQPQLYFYFQGGSTFVAGFRFCPPAHPIEAGQEVWEGWRDTLLSF